MIVKSWDSAFRADKKGSAATRDRAFKTWRALESFAREKKWKSTGPENITPKQMNQFLDARAGVITPRSVQNEASHLRRAIAGAGRDIGNVRDAKNQWSSTRMKMPEGSRLGLKSAMNHEIFAIAREKLPPDIRALTDLQLALGMRRKESVMSMPSLAEWERKMTALADRPGVFLPVTDGTKGHRPRHVFVPVANFARLRLAIAAAKAAPIHIADRSLEQSLTRYSNAMRRAGLTGENSGHGLRRGFAQDQFRLYRDSSLDEKTTLMRLSEDLGHGDSRGRWVSNNYLAGGRA